jgi:hypothetical protein
MNRRRFLQFAIGVPAAVALPAIPSAPVVPGAAAFEDMVRIQSLLLAHAEMVANPAIVVEAVGDQVEWRYVTEPTNVKRFYMMGCK